MITYDPSLKIFVSSKINIDGYFSGFGTKLLGDARKNDFVIHFFNSNNLTHKSLVTMQQIHSVNVSEYSEKEKRKDSK